MGTLLGIVLIIIISVIFTIVNKKKKGGKNKDKAVNEIAAPIANEATPKKPEARTRPERHNSDFAKEHVQKRQRDAVKTVRTRTERPAGLTTTKNQTPKK